MKNKCITYFLFTLLIPFILFAQPKYEILNLGTLNTEESWASDINEKGQICGIFRQNGYYKTYFWIRKWESSLPIYQPFIFQK